MPDFLSHDIYIDATLPLNYYMHTKAANSLFCFEIHQDEEFDSLLWPTCKQHF